MHAHDRDDDAENEVDRDEEAVEGAVGAREEGVEHACESNCKNIHERRGSDENPLPEVGGG